MKVRNTHIGRVAGIPAKQIGDASAEDVKRWPWALVPVEAPAPAKVKAAKAQTEST